MRRIVGGMMVALLVTGGGQEATPGPTGARERRHTEPLPRSQPAPATPPAPPRAPPDTLVLVYSEQRIGDGAQAKIAEFIAAVVPPGEWPTIRRKTGETLSALVDRVYDYYPNGEFAKPRTASALAKAIVELNDSVAAGVDLKVPPMPVRGNGRFGYGPRLRVFDTRSAGYAMNQEPETFAAATDAAADGQQAKVVTELADQRGATATALTVSAAHVRSASVARGRLPGLPEGVAVLSARVNDAGETEDVGFSEIEFLTGGDEAPRNSAPTVASCDAGSKWLDASSYRQLATVRLSDEVKLSLSAKATASPLVLFDFDFTGAGHGNKVRSVVDFALQSLGLSLSNGIRTVDFLVHSKGEKEALEDTLTDFLASLKPSDPRRQYEQAARQWIAAESEQVIFGAYRIHDLVLQALFWQHLRGPSVVNLSFRLRSPAMRVLAPEFMSAQPSAFATIAAGNESGRLEPIWVPQDTPQNLANAINVTHGLLDGTILGTRSADGHPFRGVVSLLAPGCGFAAGQVVPTDSGSSLAAPYAAVAVWLKHLLDGETGPALRRSLLRAVVPVPGQSDGIESGGIFDPARLLADVGPHLRLRDGAIVPIAAPLLSVQCVGAPPGVFRHFEPQPDEWQSVVLVREVDAVRVWNREIPTTQDLGVRIRRSCDLLSLRFMSGSLTFGTLEAFEQTVAEIVM
jgi:hypothetical protein